MQYGKILLFSKLIEQKKPNHGDTETQRKANKKLRDSVSPWFKMQRKDCSV